MKVFAENRKARNSYEFQEFYEAGIVLTGPETKSVRTCLLYTSPSPRDRSLSRMPSSA